MKAKLCRCNKCDTVMIDQNPQINTTEFEVPSNATDMQFIDAKDGGFWACPVCEDDGYLMDITEESKIPAVPSTPLVYNQQESELRDKSLKWWVNLGHETAAKLRDKYYPNRPLLTADERLKIYLSETERKGNEWEKEDDEMRRAYQIADQQDWEAKAGSYAHLKDKQPESKQPLYKVLKNKIKMEYLICFKNPEDEKGGYIIQSSESKELTYYAYSKENAQYAALAINNLHILAEALEPFIKLADAVLKDTLKTSNSPLYGYNNVTLYVRDLVAAKQALQNIS